MARELDDDTGAAERARAVAGRLAVARARIESAGGDPGAVRVVAVTKGHGPEAVVAALDAGLLDIGENYAQELVAKSGALSECVLGGRHAEEPPPRTSGEPVGDTLRWHFLGSIQRNKVAALAPLVYCWQGVARAVEGEAIARRRPGARVLVEVELSGDPRRNGCPPPSVRGLVADLRRLDLDVCGLMAVAPVGPGAAEPAFRTVRALADDLGLAERSMGMSDDLEAAVAQGSTMVRLGRALFGPRQAPGAGAR